MYTTNTRIKKLRKALDLTQAEFASRIGSTQNAVTGYETGRRNPSSSVINNICKEFHVSEEWLRTGSGEMFWQMSWEDEISAFVGNILANESAEFKRRFLAALIHLDETGWKAMEQFAIELVKSHDAADERTPRAHPPIAAALGGDTAPPPCDGRGGSVGQGRSGGLLPGTAS